MKPLDPSLAKLERLLIDAGGDFIPGQKLAADIGIPMLSLGHFIARLRQQRPNLGVEGRRGHGYRAFDRQQLAAVAGSIPDPSYRNSPTRGSGIEPMYQRMARNMAMMDLIPPATAEIIKVIALETEELPAETLARLVDYGCEVHRDLVFEGQNPLGLKRSTFGRAA